MPTSTLAATVIRQSLEELKADMGQHARGAIARFERDTGLTVRGIEIDCDVLDVRGDRCSLVRSVHVRLVDVES